MAESISKFLTDLAVTQPWVLWVIFALGLLGSLVVLGGAIVAATPSLEDDAFLAKLEAHPIAGGILKFLAAFSPLQKKAPAKPPVAPQV